MTKANTAGQRYGMPPLNKCPQALGKHRQSPSPAQLAGPWQVETASLFPVQMVPAAVVGGRIWVVGGLTGPEQCNERRRSSTTRRCTRGVPARRCPSR